MAKLLGLVFEVLSEQGPAHLSSPRVLPSHTACLLARSLTHIVTQHARSGYLPWVPLFQLVFVRVWARKSSSSSHSAQGLVRNAAVEAPLRT